MPDTLSRPAELSGPEPALEGLDAPGTSDPGVASVEPAPESSASGGESPRTVDRSRTAGLVAIGAFVVLGLGLIALSPRHSASGASSSVALTDAVLVADGGSGASLAPAAAITFSADAGVGASAPVAPPPRPPPVWRVAQLKGESGVEVVEGTFGKKGFVQSLTQAGVSRPEIKRVAHAFEGLHRASNPAATDSFVVARDKSKGTVLAFEYVTSPLDVWQAKLEEGSDRTVTRKLDLFVEHKRVATAFAITEDLPKAIAAAGLRPEIVEAVDDALDGHIEGGALRGGVRMRVAATEDWVEGAYARIRVDAVELIPPKGSAPLRVYFYERDASVEGSHRRAPAAGFYDAKGKQPYRGAFRSPLALARVTSRFNMKRMHPVLHVVMPHNGVDYGATTGTPVYASAAGTITTAGNGGPCGNMIEIAHAGGISTAYCHLNGFATGIHSGMKVEPRQLIGYVGHTGRVTGPHLHFVVKKNGVYVDPLGLKMDGVRVLPPADRDAFAKKRADLDGILDGVALPSAADIPDEPEDNDNDVSGGD